MSHCPIFIVLCKLHSDNPVHPDEKRTGDKPFTIISSSCSFIQTVRSEIDTCLTTGQVSYITLVWKRSQRTATLRNLSSLTEVKLVRPWPCFLLLLSISLNRLRVRQTVLVNHQSVSHWLQIPLLLSCGCPFFMHFRPNEDTNTPICICSCGYGIIWSTKYTLTEKGLYCFLGRVNSNWEWCALHIYCSIV